MNTFDFLIIIAKIIVKYKLCYCYVVIIDFVFEFFVCPNCYGLDSNTDGNAEG